MGEFGACANAFLYGRGREKWVADMLDICKEQSVHFTYHAYHEPSFGLYSDPASKLPEMKNEVLAQVFIDKLAN